MRYENRIGVTIDEISHLYDNIFNIHLIPDIKSEFFIPAHLRYLRVYAELLESQFLQWIRQRIDNLSTDSIGSVVQGGYYKLPSDIIYANHKEYNQIIFGRNNDIFINNKLEYSPYDESGIMSDLVSFNTLNLAGTKIKSNTILYGFNVGQGDMMLLITAEKNAYIIDCNIYSKTDLQTKIIGIKKILNKNNMNLRKIRGLIITHKHSDHIRGANCLIDSGEFDIEHLIMNLDYLHPTSLVNKLLTSSKKHIPKWINLNHPCEIYEGDTIICFKNPDTLTKLAPDINDSSIAMCIRHKGNLIYLTGDASDTILENKMDCGLLSISTERLLKISHHGSRTGTSDDLINMLSPKEAFISAGTSKKYGHPHIECLDILNKHVVNTIITKNVKRTVEYRCDGYYITQKIIV